MSLRRSRSARAALLVTGLSVALGLALVLTLTPAARGGRVTLKDGTVLEGTVIKTSDGYWVKGADGQTHKVKADEVDSLDNGTGASKPAAAGASAPARPA